MLLSFGEGELWLLSIYFLSDYWPVAGSWSLLVKVMFGGCTTNRTLEQAVACVVRSALKWFIL